ncbi:hypothetical protein H0O03_03240 [Candidatus Micrarchaeota archaeon]|nr:hypothetical protein [Candidatus Micrarchaeota archaeon]
MPEKKMVGKCEDHGYVCWAKKMLVIILVFLVFYIFLRYVLNLLDPVLGADMLAVATAILTFGATRCGCYCRGHND